jgi:lipopolysaccharide biosynthesis protein
LSVKNETTTADIKLIAFYLPQFHPIPENDEWWGRGFTEWTNVTRAKPLFRGHYQPHLPADLGFYDLRLPETRQAQADMAKEYGIFGFCYYHYWFGGRRVLQRPFEEVLASGQPDFPFCLCWANENWTRRWDGYSSQILLEQTYSAEDDLNHIRWLIKAFRDKRYIRISGKPLFLIYRVGSLPCPSQTAETWRREARMAGIGEIYLCAVESNFTGSRVDPRDIGFDAAVEFQPSRLQRRALMKFWEKLKLGVLVRGAVSYDRMLEEALRLKQPEYSRFRCVTPSWDNSARRKSLILIGANPEKYSKWLKSAIESSPLLPDGGKLVFINAWNEWAEGNHLEPCQRWGREYLESTKKVLEEVGRESRQSRVDSDSEAPQADSTHL